MNGEQQPLSNLHTVMDNILIQKVSCGTVLSHYVFRIGSAEISQDLCLQYYKVSPNELKVGTLADAALFKIAARDC